MDNYDHYSLYGPFKNPDDIEKFWYLVTEKEIEEEIKFIEEDLRDLETPKKFKDKDKELSPLQIPKLTKKEKEDYKQERNKELEGLNKELRDLQKFVESYLRCLERHKYDKKVLEQIQRDWEDYNFSLYTDWNRISIYMLDRSEMEGEALKNNQKKAKSEKIKREEIERRMKLLLD